MIGSRSGDSRALCAFVLLCIAAVVLLLCASGRGFRPSLVLLGVPAIVGALLCAMEVGKERITTTGLHLFAGWLMLGLAPLLNYRAGLLDQHFAQYHFFTFLPSNQELLLASAAVTMWFLYFWVGSRVGIKWRPLWVDRADIRVGFSALLVQCIAAGMALTYLYDMVGFGVLTRAQFESPEFGSPGELAFFTSTVRFVPIVALLSITLALRDGHLSGWRKVIAVALLVALCIGNLTLNNPVAAPRFVTGTVLLAFAFVLFFYRAPTGLSFLLTMLVAVFILFPLLDVGRLATDTESILDQFPTYLEQLLVEDPFRTYEAIPAALRYLDERGSTFGFQLLGPLLFWMPRSIWPMKPEGSGTALVRALGGFHDNVSCPPPCEALVNFGWVGIPLFAVGLGFALRILDAAGSRHASDRGPVCGLRLMDVAYPLLLGQVFLFTRGDFLSTWAFTVGILVATLPLLAGEAIARPIARLFSAPRGVERRS